MKDIVIKMPLEELPDSFRWLAYKLGVQNE